jgi:UDP-N-acetylmuramoylalanine--D-glutamate ligase
LGGNIGIPVLDFIDELTPEDWVVLELSSFQLTDLRRAPHIATCLMIVPDHLNWHEDMTDYVNAKANLFRMQKPSDIAIYFADDQASHAIARQSPGDKICYYDEPGAYVEDDKIKIDNQEICRVDELRIPGKHNWQNICAAVTTAWQAGVMDVVAIHHAITSFTGLPHRLERVTEAAGVTYYDDSFSTTPETTIAAVEAFHQHKVLILGGSDKGVSLQPLIDAVIASPSVRHVVTIGETGSQIARRLREASVPTSPGGQNMMDIVGQAHRAAESGDVVLLSPGCASFGLFKDYKDRGDQFKDATLRLA